MGAEGARITYPYLSGQWTEQEQYYDIIILLIIFYCFFDQSVFDMLWFFYLLT